MKIFRTLATASLAVSAIAALGCASPITLTLQPAEPDAALVASVRGPGALFTTIDEAAVDALTHAYLESKRSRARERRMLGGTVFAVEGGYSYGPLLEARATDPNRLDIPLGKSDVAHFHTYPSGTRPEDRLNETHSPRDRRNVDERDPAHRPSFVLTPSLRVKRYDGAELLVAEVGVPRQTDEGQQLALDR